jgi:hypothetical protein
MVKLQTTFVALTLLTSSLVAAPLRSNISGRVIDSEGAAIANARILIHWDAAGARSAYRATSVRGTTYQL